MPKYGQLPELQRLPEAPGRGGVVEEADGDGFAEELRSGEVAYPPRGVDIYASIFFNKLRLKFSCHWR